MKPEKPRYHRNYEAYVPREYASTDLAYMAGLIDGEGCFWIGIVKASKKSGYIHEQYRGLMKVDNTDKRLIDWIIKTFNGTASAVTRSTSSRKFERDVFSWIATGDRLLDICEIILPYLVIKKQQCEIMIKFRKTYEGRTGNQKLSEEILSIRLECLEEIRKLNSRFYHNPLIPIKNKPEKKSLAPVTGSYATASKSIRKDL